MNSTRRSTARTPLAWIGRFTSASLAARQFLRTFVLPKGAPKAALTDLRAAWEKTQKDAGYLAEYEKKNKSRLVAVSGELAQKRVNNILSIPADVKAHIEKLAKK